MSMSIRVILAGPLSTVQDCGRAGYQRFGVSVGGAMDQEALHLGNRLVGNDPCAAAIEVTLGGASFQFDDDALVAVTGADLGPTVDGLRMPNWTAVHVPCEGVLQFSGPHAGLRAYLCVAGGILTEPQLGSRSTHLGARLGGLRGVALSEGDVLPVAANVSRIEPGLAIPRELRPSYGTSHIEIRVVPGPQADAFSAHGIGTFYESEYRVTDRSDRQGLRLDGPVIEAVQSRYDIVSDAVALGSVQIPGDGKPIVLMADRQTAGGYAKIGVVATVDLPMLAQAAPGATVRFRPTDVATAQALLRARRIDLLERDLVHPTQRAAATFTINGVEHRVSVGSFSSVERDERAIFTNIESDGQMMGAHIEEVGPGELE